MSTPRRLRRVLARAAAAVVCGALVSGTVAWGGVLVDRNLAFSALRTANARRGLWADLGAAADPDHEPWIERVYSARGQEVMVIAPAPGQRLYLHRAGWPWRCLEARTVKVDPSGADQRGPEVSGGIATDLKLTLRVPTGARSQRRGTMPLVLPCRPIWMAVAASSGLYGTLLLLAWGLTRWARAGGRRLRGRCPGCGYPVGASSTCTECGRRFGRSRPGGVPAAQRAG